MANEIKIISKQSHIKGIINGKEVTVQTGCSANVEYNTPDERRAIADALARVTQEDAARDWEQAKKNTPA